MCCGLLSPLLVRGEGEGEVTPSDSRHTLRIQLRTFRGISVKRYFRFSGSARGRAWHGRPAIMSVRFRADVSGKLGRRTLSDTMELLVLFVSLKARIVPGSCIAQGQWPWTKSGSSWIVGVTSFSPSPSASPKARIIPGGCLAKCRWLRAKDGSRAGACKLSFALSKIRRGNRKGLCANVFVRSRCTIIFALGLG